MNLYLLLMLLEGFDFELMAMDAQNSAASLRDQIAVNQAEQQLRSMDALQGTTHRSRWLDNLNDRIAAAEERGFNAWRSR